jgi:tRNA 2-selenouridine synthase
MQKLNIAEYLRLAEQYPILDVRSPGEYSHAHIPGAYNLPLFSDEERKIVGTAYKQEGRQPAIKIGLGFFGLKMTKMVEEAEQVIEEHQKKQSNPASQVSKTILIHCWRGGMRSAGVAWLLDLYGFKVYTLAGGYKAYRNWVLQQFERPHPFKVLGGYTGSGKTRVLHQLAKARHAVLDLEGLAHHKGSAFGDLGELKQPAPEMFENKIAMALAALHNSEQIWVEDESRRIGDINLPQALWVTMRRSPVYFLEVPFEERLKYIVQEYGKFKKEDLVNAVMRIRKRLGGLNTKNALNYLLEENYTEAFRILLAYYDKFYAHGLHDRENLESLLTVIPCEAVDAAANCKRVLAALPVSSTQELPH